MLWDQLKLPNDFKTSLGDICIFIIRLYITTWFECVSALNTPNNDILFLKYLKLL